MDRYFTKKKEYSLSIVVIFRVEKCSGIKLTTDNRRSGAPFLIAIHFIVSQTKFTFIVIIIAIFTE